MGWQGAGRPGLHTRPTAGTTRDRHRPDSIAPSSFANAADLEPLLHDAVTAAVIVDLLGRLADSQCAGAVEDLRRLPPAMHRAVLAEAHTRTDLHRAEHEALGAGDVR